MAQTWHQLRPGEIRHDCGGCHAHSQKPTLFEDTAAAKKDYKLFDLTKQTPLLTAKKEDKSGKKWDKDDTTGLHFADSVKNVEYFRDIKPILDRSCAACHTGKLDNIPGNLVLDDDKPMDISYVGKVPGTYFRLAADRQGKFGHKPIIGAWRQFNASRYVREFQSRRSLLVWKIYGERLDGWSNDDFPSEAVPGDPTTLTWKGQPVKDRNLESLADLDYTGTAMPPPEAVAGTYKGPDGKPIKVAPLSDEDKRTIVRWIDLGCPIDLDYNPAKPQARGYGWMLDDNRPTLALPYPQPGVNAPLTKLVVGMHDYGTGLDLDSFTVAADFAINGVAAGENLAKGFKARGDGIWELPLTQPLAALSSGKLTVSVKDRQGNVTRIERTFSVKK
ncbi:hypothetical protein AYO44_14305 [Planctomycetaceae bacterium SCGC AG-212-F19]|nr:hypothetical protein AYO44_14305 [Planctomycetaceae bacterium SCGC AG-212-F19]